MSATAGTHPPKKQTARQAGAARGAAREAERRARAEADAAILPIVLAAKAGDELAMQRVWEASIPVARKVASLYCGKYQWIDHDDLSADLLLAVPRFVVSYNPEHSSGTEWMKFLYHKFYFFSKDVLRREDPLGIGFPQKREYPSWHRLGDKSLEGYDAPDEATDEQIDGVAGLSEELEISTTVADCHELLFEVAPHRYSQKTGKLFSKKQSPKRLKRRRPKAKSMLSSLKNYISQRRENAMEYQQQPMGQPPQAPPQPQQPVAYVAPQPPATPPEAQPAAQAQQVPANKPDRWTPARRRRFEANKAAGVAKRKSPSKQAAKRSQSSRPRSAKAKQAATRELSAAELIVLASKFIDAAGGCSRAASLIEQIGNLRK